jgi:hypothetical protein
MLRCFLGTVLCHPVSDHIGVRRDAIAPHKTYLMRGTAWSRRTADELAERLTMMSGSGEAGKALHSERWVGLEPAWKLSVRLYGYSSLDMIKVCPSFDLEPDGPFGNTRPGNCENVCQWDVPISNRPDPVEGGPVQRRAA